jgi:hypothetical protein
MHNDTINIKRKNKKTNYKKTMCICGIEYTVYHDTNNKYHILFSNVIKNLVNLD